MPTASPKLNSDTRDFLRNQYYYSQLLKEPKKVVDLFDTYSNFWKRVSGVDSKEYAQPLLTKMLNDYGKEIDAIGITADLFGKSYPYLLVVKPSIGLLKIYNDQMIENRNEFGLELIKADRTGEIYNMVERMSQLPEIFGQAVAEGQIKNPDIAASAIENIKILENFKKGLDIPTSDNELLLKAPQNAVQILLADAFKNAEKRTETEGADHYEEILEEELKKLSEDHLVLNKKLKELMDAVLYKKKDQETPDEVIKRISNLRGWGDIIGILIGIGNPKLGTAISSGTKAAMDAYQSFNLISAFGFNATTLATGLGGVMTVISIINSYGDNAEQNQMNALFTELYKINDNINSLRQEVQELKSNVLQILDQVQDLIQFSARQFSVIENDLNIILQTIEEFSKMDQEANFQQLELEIVNINNNMKDHLSTFDSFRDHLKALYKMGIIDASNEKITRTKEGSDFLYEYLALDSKIKYDEFKWSPIESRPILLDNLRSQFLSSLSEGNKAIWEKQLRPFKQEVNLGDILNDLSEMISPIIASRAAIGYMDFLYDYFVFYFKEKTQNQNKEILYMIGDFQRVFSWYSKTVFVLANEKVVRSMLDKYLDHAMNLILHINDNRKANISVLNAVIDPSFKKIQLDTFLLDAVHSKLDLDYSELNIGVACGYLEDFFSFNTQLDIPFEIIQNEILHPPFMSGQIIPNINKLGRLNLHHDILIKDCPENIDTFLYLLSYFKDLGILKIEKQFFVGNYKIDPDIVYDNPIKHGINFYGELTVKYIITIDQAKSSISNILEKDFKIEFTFADTRLGLKSLFNYAGTTESRYMFSPLAGSGSLIVNYEHDPVLYLLPADLLSESFFNLIESAIFPTAIVSFKDKITELKNIGIYIGLSSTSKVSTLLTFENKSDTLKNLFIETRDAWINLTTAVLCYSEVNLDSSIYLELLNRKPQLLQVNFSFSQSETYKSLTGENLSDLLLLWIGRNKDENGFRKPFAGLEVRGGNGVQPEIFAEEALPIIWLSFNEKDNENPVKYELLKSQQDQLFHNIVQPQEPLFYRPVLPACNKALETLSKAYLYFMIEG